MIIAYLVPVSAVGGFSTRAAETTRREVWCCDCATPCDKTLPVPADHIEINDCQVGPGYNNCAACGKDLKQSDCTDAADNRNNQGNAHVLQKLSACRKTETACFFCLTTSG